MKNVGIIAIIAIVALVVIAMVFTPWHNPYTEEPFEPEAGDIEGAFGFSFILVDADGKEHEINPSGEGLSLFHQDIEFVDLYYTVNVKATNIDGNFDSCEFDYDTFKTDWEIYKDPDNGQTYGTDFVNWNTLPNKVFDVDGNFKNLGTMIISLSDVMAGQPSGNYRIRLSAEGSIDYTASPGGMPETYTLAEHIDQFYFSIQYGELSFDWSFNPNPQN